MGVLPDHTAKGIDALRAELGKGATLDASFVKRHAWQLKPRSLCGWLVRVAARNSVRRSGCGCQVILVTEAHHAGNVALGTDLLLVYVEEGVCQGAGMFGLCEEMDELSLR